MGNRGTTPSWDDEQIAKFGFAAHWDMVSAPFRAQERRRREELVNSNIDAVLELLPNATEEERTRVAFAIPDVITAFSMGDLAVANWCEYMAELIYKDWRKRTGQSDLSYEGLPEGDKEAFRRIVEAIVQIQSKKKP